MCNQKNDSTYHTWLNDKLISIDKPSKWKGGHGDFSPAAAPSHTVHQQACVSDCISDKCLLSSQKETPLETKQAFPLLAAQAELQRPDAACKDAGPRQVSPVCPN